MRFPTSGQPIDLLVPAEADLHSHVLGFDGERLTISLPSTAQATHTLAIGRELTLQWVDEARGIFRMPVAVVARGVGDFATLDLAVEGEPRLTQRRNHVRAAITLACTARAGDRQLSGLTLDVSGGGVLVELEPGLRVRELLELTIQLHGGETAEAVARVERVDDSLVGCSFEQIAPAHREHLIRLVFASLRSARAATGLRA